MPNNKKEDIMKFETVLPEDFDGTFKFTNWSDTDFVATWGSIDYVYPALSTSQMIMPEFSPLEIQNIRKKFAKKLAQREFGKTSTYEMLLKQERNDDGTPRSATIQGAGTYNDDQLAPLIQRALEPLPLKKAAVNKVQKQPLEDTLSRDEEGELQTKAIDKNTKLVKES